VGFTKLRAITDAKGRHLKFFMTAGEVGDYTGAAALLSSLPTAEWMIADQCYNAECSRDALKDKGIRPCIPDRSCAAKLSTTTSGVIAAATASRSCAVA
jgi:transposase